MILALIGALFIGLTLGLLGSGGSILTVPVLTYLVGQETKLAIASALFIVGIVSCISAFAYARQKYIRWSTVWLFGLPGMAGAMVGAWGAHFVSDVIQMLGFAALMLMAAYLMYKPLALKPNGHQYIERSVYKIIADGFVVGVVTGMVGVGGGFLIIPALVLLGGLSMRLAVGTSLVITSMKSFAGFFGYLSVLQSLNLTIDWSVIGLFALIGSLGGLLGNLVSQRVNQQRLKQAFAVCLMLMGLFILVEQALTLL